MFNKLVELMLKVLDPATYSQTATLRKKIKELEKQDKDREKFLEDMRALVNMKKKKAREED